MGRGIVAGILAAAAFGAIPAFSIPVMQTGLSSVTVLFYRFFLAAIMIAIVLKAQGKGLSIKWRDVPSMIMVTLFYCVSSGCLLLGYRYMTAGVTGVIHFTYPIFVTVILTIFFRERLSVLTMSAILIAIAGIYSLGVLGGDAAYVEGENSLVGFLIVLLSGVGCAAYMVSVNKSSVGRYPSLLLSFWLLLLSAIVFGGFSIAIGDMTLVTDSEVIFNLLALALIATVLSNVLLVYSIKIIGSTYASILGAIEPVTAVMVGLILFGDTLNLPIVVGVLLIFCSVGIIIYKGSRK